MGVFFVDLQVDDLFELVIAIYEGKFFCLFHKSVLENNFAFIFDRQTGVIPMKLTMFQAGKLPMMKFGSFTMSLS